MRKILIVLFSLTILTGCMKIEENSDNINMILDETLNNSNIFVNRASTGYEYYLPTGVSLVQDNDYNQIYYAYNTNIYLYVDIISYYYQNHLNHNDKDYNYYYTDFNYNNKNGYLLINYENNKYFVKIVYYYAKIELYTSKENLNKVIAISSIILKSINYNDKIIENIIDNNNIIHSNMTTYSEINYELDKPKDTKNTFNQYLEEYIQEETVTEELPEE